ncbi:MAG: ANR family transcriptional regulator [Plesiomonas sp.]|uniref:ANR family transcriptional regulator n=1 Tax=Plesiomonas sp. TaxID=2486279 RepID=UPI003F3E5442
MNINVHEAKNNYAAYALGAARAEQRGDYIAAAELWGKASTCPVNAARYEWAVNRRDFCLKAKLRAHLPEDEKNTVA